MHQKALGSSFLIAGILACAPGVQAQETSATGHSVYFPGTQKVVELSDGRSAVDTTFDGYVITDDENSTFNLVAQDCAGTDLMSADGALVISSGYCAGRDRDGDMYWFSYWNTPESNKWTLTGGTGKFEGIRGGGTSRPLAMHEDGTFSLRWEGTWTTKSD